MKTKKKHTGEPLPQIPWVETREIAKRISERTGLKIGHIFHEAILEWEKRYAATPNRN